MAAKSSKQTLDEAVESLRIRSDGGTNLGGPTTAELNDSGRNFDHATQGSSFESDDVFKSAWVQESANADTYPWKDKINELLQTGPQHTRSAASSVSKANARDSHEYDHFKCSGDSSGEPLATGAMEEEDWETVVDESAAPRITISPIVGKEVHSNGKSAVKQRGRGSFTYGGMGLYSDNLELNADKSGSGSSCSHSDHSVDGDASNVLVLDCSSKITTKDVEDVVEPYSREGNCAVRWVDNSRALARFSSPTMAREALVGINDGRFKISMLSETDVIPGSQPSMNDTVPVPRPASSAKVAQRMIASALSRQGISKQLRAKTQGSLQEIQEQERQRKSRLQLRAQLRDEAWGSDDD